MNAEDLELVVREAFFKVTSPYKFDAVYVIKATNPKALDHLIKLLQRIKATQKTKGYRVLAEDITVEIVRKHL